jgi:signal transduction histidine kinase
VVPAEDTLTTITDGVTNALRVPYAAIELRHDHEYVLTAGTGEPQEVALTLPLVHRGEEIGRLLVSGRAPGARFSTADEELLENIARQAGAAAYSVRLLAEVQKSRERLVNALEEERRRIRRDLHDELGPSLAGMSLQLETARYLVERDPAKATVLLEGMAAKTQTAITDIRELVYGLRPPALDELGLVGALSEQASRFEGTNGLRISVQAEGDLSGLPAATEVAAYRITLEAITNAAKHAGATRCDINLRRADELSIEVTDDGSGLPENLRWGVGITSMRERAEEVGGTLSLSPVGAKGTAVQARLPVTFA